MAATVKNIARVGVARVGLARLKYGTASYTPEITPLTMGGGNTYEADYIAAAGGVATFAGSTTPPIDYIADDPTGGMLTDGVADFEPEYAPAVSGGGVFVGDSSATSEADYIAAASGVATFAGMADFEPEYQGNSGGVATFTGVASFLIEFAFLPSGAILVSGEAEPLEADYIAATVVTAITMGGASDFLFSIDRKGLPVFLRKFDGDVRLVLSLDGGVITVWAGQPQMDGGMETAVNISLFTEIGWWGNSIIGVGNEVGSDFEDALRQPLSNQARLNVIESARNALQWLLDTGIAETVDFTATIPAVGRLDFNIQIKQPEKTPETFRYNVNWANQKIIMTEAAA